MVNLNVGCLQDEGVIFVWVTGELSGSRFQGAGHYCMRFTSHL